MDKTQLPELNKEAAVFKAQVDALRRWICTCGGNAEDVVELESHHRTCAYREGMEAAFLADV